MASEFRRLMFWKFSLIIVLTAGAGVALGLRGIRRGLDLSGGTELQYAISVGGLSAEEKTNITQQTIDVITRRVNPTGTIDMDVRPVGSNRFSIRLPGMSTEDARRVEQNIQRAGKLLFCIVNNTPADCAKASRGERVPSCTPFVLSDQPDVTGGTRRRFVRKDFRDLPVRKLQPQDWIGVGRNDRAVLVQNTPVITGESLDTSQVYETTDRKGGIAINFAFSGKGRSDFADITERNKGKYLAIILDDILYSAPVINERIYGTGIIESPNGFERAEAQDLIKTLQAGSLKADIDLEWRHGIGPALGEDSIRAGVMAAIIGLSLVVILMGTYYMASGLVAIFALVLNAVLLLGTMALFGTTMTLPGIAGLILTLGMAVDANVLICERIREEKERGKTLRLAVKTGYDRAFVTIIDSNLTTIITAFILYFVGSGAVKGFAIVLIIGLLASLFTSVFVTRAVTELLIAGNVFQKMRMFQFFRLTNVPFSKARYICMGGSAALIIIGLIVFVSRGDKKYDSDFLGGFAADMELQNPMPTSEFRSRVEAAGYAKAEVQSLWVSGTSTSDKASLFSIRVAKLDPAKSMEKIKSDLEQQLGTAGLLKQIVQTQDWTYEIATTRPITERDLRAQLRLAQYEMTDIADITSSQLRDSQFTLYIGGGDLTDKQLEDARKNAEQALRSIVATRVRKYTAGEVQSLVQGTRGTVYSLDLNFNEWVPRQALEETLKRDAPEAAKDPAFRVMGTGRDEGADECLNVRVEAGDRSMLANLAALTDKTMSIPYLLHLRPDVLEIETSEQVTPTVLREKLGAGLLPSIQAIVPQKATATDFTVTMVSRLKDEKVTEKIREDLEKAFRNDLAQKRLSVSFAALPAAPSFVSHPEDFTKAGYAFLELQVKDPEKGVPQEVSLQIAADNLRRAGYPEALLSPVSQQEMPQTAKSTIYLKYQPTVTPLEKVESDIRNVFTMPQPFRRIESVGGSVSAEMKTSAFWAAVLSVLAMLVYIWFRFGEVRFGVGAIIATAHDVLITMGAVAVADALSATTIGATLGFAELKINLVMVGAFLTMVGYSVNDTIVIFDRIRENMGGRRGRVDPHLIDNSINQTLSRTVITSFATLLVVIALYFFGGPVLHGFAFVMTFGIIVGSYSTIFIAAPILLEWHRVVAFMRQIVRVATFKAPMARAKE